MKRNLEYQNSLAELAELLVTPERFSKLASNLGQLALEYPDLPVTHMLYGSYKGV